MTTPPTLPTDADARAARALRALAGISAELASARALETSIERMLTTVRELVEASETAVWLHAPQGIIRGWTSGGTSITEAEVRVGLAAGGVPGGPHIEPIVLGERRVGVLALRLTRPLGSEERLLVTALANLLAPELTHAERSRQLDVEVASRTAEIGRGRRFTEKPIDSRPPGRYAIVRSSRLPS